MGAFFKTHAVSLAIHAGIVAIIALIVPQATRALDRSEEIEIEVISRKAVKPAAPAAPPPVVPPPLPIPSEPRPERVPELTKVAMVDKAKPFQEQARPDTGSRDAPDDTPAVPAATTPLPNVDMEATVVGSATDYVTTAETGGSMGVRAGSGQPGGTGGGQGNPGPAGNQGAIDVRVSPDWEITHEPEPLNDGDFEPDYPTLAKREAREGVVVVRLWIDERGHVEKSTVLEPAGHGFDEAALAYAQRLRFRPARAGTREVASRIDWTVEFNARN